MNTEIEFLSQLEVDLMEATYRESSRAREAATPATRRRPGQKWMRVAGVAAAFLVVAGAIGFLLGPTAMDKFQQVGDAVASGGSEGGGVAAPSPAASRAPGAEAGFDSSGKNVDQGFTGRHEFAVGGQLGDLSKIIRDGRIGVVVPDGTFGDTVGSLTFIAEQHRGFIISSSTQNERTGTFVLRIPAKRFDAALADVRALGRVRFQQIQGDDVTAEFIDNQARLRILLARKALLFDLFQKADTTEEILRLASQLDDVQLRIEQIQGQIRFINDQVAESTLRVSIQERNAPEATAEQEIDNPDLGSSFDLAVQGFLRIVGAVIVGLGYLIPLTALAAIAWLAVWLARRRPATS